MNETKYKHTELRPIPEHWEIGRLANYFTERREKVSDIEFAPLSVTKNGVLPQLDNVAKSNDSENRKGVRKGDFVINSRSDRKGSSGVSDRDGSVSLINIVLTPRKSINTAYCNYLLKSQNFIEEFYRYGRGIVADLWTTRYSEMKLIKLAIPPLHEQEAMVAYLDEQTGKIDAAIEREQKMIDLLNERKQIIIQQAVTKGLNPNAPMKDSGIDWIGPIPEHWEIMKVKFLINEKLMYGANESPDGLSTNEPRYIRITDIDDNGKLKPETYCSLSSFKAQPYLLKKGDVLLARSGATVGKSFLFDEDIKACFAGYLIKASFGELMNPHFFNFITKTGFYNEWKKSIAIQATIQNIGADKYANLEVPVPPTTDQEHIISYIEKKLLPIDKAIESREKLISLLRERKQIIVNEVVTGKIKVS